MGGAGVHWFLGGCEMEKSQKDGRFVLSLHFTKAFQAAKHLSVGGTTEDSLPC